MSGSDRLGLLTPQCVAARIFPKSHKLSESRWVILALPHGEHSETHFSRPSGSFQSGVAHPFVYSYGLSKD